MNNFDLSRQDIDQIIQRYNQHPTADDYFVINQWYGDNNQTFSDQEYIMCVYLFLVGANIKSRYMPISYQDQRRYIKEIREIIEGSSSLNRAQRLVYLNYGSKPQI